MPAKARERFWRRVVVWWVVLAVALTVSGVVALSWASYEWTRPRNKWSGNVSKRESDTIAPGWSRLWMWWHVDGPFATIAQLRLDVSEADDFDIANDLKALRVPEDVQAWLTDDEIDETIRLNQWAAGRRPMAMRRIRDSAGEILRQDIALHDMFAVDIRCCIPVANAVATFPWFYSGKIAVPDAVRKSYPLVIPLDGGRTQVMIRIWNVMGIAAACSAVVASVPVGIGATRRAVRKRKSRCVECGYSLVGIDGAVCPECGGSR